MIIIITSNNIFTFTMYTHSKHKAAALKAVICLITFKSLNSVSKLVNINLNKYSCLQHIPAKRYSLISNNISYKNECKCKYNISYDIHCYQFFKYISHCSRRNKQLM